MNNNSRGPIPLIIAALIGSVITYLSLSFFNQKPDSMERKPLYWVAPMDANYKKDKPGKSPMGMDLIPVYEQADSTLNAELGSIKISPEVVNNLGVRLVKAKYQALDTKITTVGYVKYDEEQLIHIHPRVEGWIEKLHVKAAGDPVAHNQALYEIYSPALVNAQEEFLLALDRKNQRLIRAAEDRLQALQLPAMTVKQLRKTKKVQQNITVYAPQSGVVDNLNIREGFFVNPGTTLMSIGKLDQVWVEAEVFERQVSEIAVGIPVTMTLAYLPGKQWQGKVDYIYPALNAKTRTVKVRLRFDNKSETLKPNMFARVVIHAKSNQNSLLIPKEAVIRSGSNERVVLALGDGRFKSINVEIGRYDEAFAEILSGLNEGDAVVSSAQFLLDSESSKTSDFKRMNYQEDEVMDMTSVADSSADKTEQTVPTTVWVEATINSVMAGHRMVNVTHQAIEQWDWPEMTMNFTVADSIDMMLLKKTMTLHIELEKNSQGDYLLINIHLPDDAMDGEMQHD